MEKGGHLQSADSADCTVPSRMAPSSCGKGSDSLCHSSCTSGIDIFRQPLCFRSPFNPVPKMLTEGASQDVGTDDLKEHSWWKAAPFWPCATLCHLTSTSTCPQAGVQLCVWALAMCWNEGIPSVWEAVQYPEEGEAAGCHQQQCVCKGATRAAGTCPPHMTLRCSMEEPGCASSDHTALIWRCEIGVVETAEEERSLSEREADCVASFCNWSAPSMCCNKKHEENLLWSHLQQESWTMQSLTQPHSLSCPLLLITLAWTSLRDFFNQGENHDGAHV